VPSEGRERLGTDLRATTTLAHKHPKRDPRMRHGTRIAASAVMLATAAVALGTVLWTPISCGCVDGWANLYFLIGQSGMPDELTAQRVEQGLMAKYRGKPVTPETFNNINSSYECASAVRAANQIICTWYIWQSKTRTSSGTDDTRLRGFNATFDRDSKGLLRSVRVIEVETPRS